MQKRNLPIFFSNLIFAGKCKSALELLSHGDREGILHLPDWSDPTNHLSEKYKHLIGQSMHGECILQLPLEDPHPIIFDSLDISAIRSAAMRITGSAGPSSLDAHEWRRLCTFFKEAFSEICHNLALTAPRICTSYVDPASI